MNIIDQRREVWTKKGKGLAPSKLDEYDLFASNIPCEIKSHWLGFHLGIWSNGRREKENDWCGLKHVLFHFISHLRASSRIPIGAIYLLKDGLSAIEIYGTKDHIQTIGFASFVPAPSNEIPF